MAARASNNEKISTDFVYEIMNFDSPNLIILKKKSLRIQQNIIIFLQNLHFWDPNRYFFLFYLREMLHS